MRLFLNDLDPKAVRVQLYADGITGGPSVCQEMNGAPDVARGSGWYLYRATVSASRPPEDYTPRVIPYYEGVGIPLEDAHIGWRRRP